jgi:predicted nucleic acid-binding Zn ribbon protein
MSAATRQPHGSCVECGKPVMRRRSTALYCSGKCREIHNARKRRQARTEMKAEAQPAAAPATAYAPETEA